MGKARYHYLQLNPPFTVVSAARPYNDMLPVLRLSDAGPAGWARWWQVQCREPKKRQQKVCEK